MDLIKILRNLRNQIIYNNQKGFSEHVKFKVKHKNKNIAKSIWGKIKSPPTTHHPSNIPY